MPTPSRNLEPTTLNYASITLYVMSGTGNSHRVACWLRDACAETEGPTPQIRRIERGVRPDSSTANGKTLTGIVTPTHAFTAPWPVIRFVGRLPRGQGGDAFCVATRGGIQAGRTFVRGVSGSATFLVGLLLALKGYRVRGLRSIDMPSNWTACYSGPPPEKAAAVIERARPRAREFMERIRSGDRVAFNSGNLYDLLTGLLLLPISALYLPIGRFFLAKLFFANHRCTGCGFCSRHCPHRAIWMLGRKHPHPYWRMRCVSCMRCMSFCPRQAVEAGHSWAVLLAWITHAPVAVWAISRLAARFPALAPLNAPWPLLGARLAYLYLSLWAAYWIFHLLIRLPAVNAFFTWSTFTRFYRRYHEPGTSVKDLAG